jgi:hypothetical protein
MVNVVSKLLSRGRGGGASGIIHIPHIPGTACVGLMCYIFWRFQSVNRKTCTAIWLGIKLRNFWLRIHCHALDTMFPYITCLRLLILSIFPTIFIFSTINCYINICTSVVLVGKGEGVPARKQVMIIHTKLHSENVKGSLRRCRHRWEDNIQIVIKKMVWGQALDSSNSVQGPQAGSLDMIISPPAM